MALTSSRIAIVEGSDNAAIQSLLAAAVAGWRASGTKVVGVLEETHGLPGRICGAGILRDIVSRKPYSIYLGNVPSNTSCHLDAEGVDAACSEMMDQISTSELVVLSKFGKLEAKRKGLSDAFVAAVAADKPLISTISDKHRDEWRAFAPDAVYLAADEGSLIAWWCAVKGA